jgi:TRAP-type transport system small permease protein
MQKLLNTCETVMTYAAVVSTFVMMCLTTVDAGGRYIFNRPVTGAYEITSNYLIVAMVFFALSYGYRQGSYIRVTFFVDRFRGQVKVIMNCFVQFISTLYGMALVVATIQQFFRIFTSGTNLSSLAVPVWPAYGIVPLGLFFMSLLMLLDLRRVRKHQSSLFREESPSL